ncbi:MAG: hypothetical protein EBR30_06715 [Cytophagia bacterium]|nr:hypothetical protein [Cytophagia bacterium]
MPRYLNIDAELKQETRIQKNQDDEHTQGLKQIQGIPEDEGVRGLKFILKNSADTEVERIPKTEQDVSPFPDGRYVVYYAQETTN